MEREYRISTGYKIFYAICSLALVAFGIFLLVVSNSQHARNGIISALVLFVVAAIFALYNIKRKVIISDDLITVTGLLGSKQASVHDIKGFRNKSKGLITLYLTDGRKKINVYSSEVFAKSEELLQWMDDNLSNLDREEYEAEKVLILQDSELGFTEEERKRVFAKANTQAIIFNILGLILLIVSFFFKETFFPYAIFVLVFPFAGLVIIAINKGLVKLYSKQSSAYSSVLLGVLFSGGALIFQSLNNDSLLNVDKVWMPVLIGALVITVIITLLLKQANDIKMQVFTAVLVSLVLSFGAVRQINKIFDKSAPEVFPVSIVRLYEYHKKGTTYHIVIDGWKDHTSEADIVVSENFYYEVAGHSKINVNLKRGTLNIPWYYISL